MAEQDSRPPFDDVAGVILAGGLSRRMGGGDKTLKDLGGVSMLAHVVGRLARQVGPLVLNANGDDARFAAFGLPVVPDPVGGFLGPLAGVLAGLQWTKRNAQSCRYIVTAASDAPFLPLDLVARLRAGSEGQDIVLAASGGELHPVIGLWPVALANDLEAALASGVRKVLAWTDKHRTASVEFPFEEMHGERIDPFFNANRPEELAEARRLLSRIGPNG